MGPAAPPPLTSKRPRWKRAAERLAKQTDTSGLPGSSWDAACGDQRAAAWGGGHGDPSAGAAGPPSPGIPSGEPPLKLGPPDPALGALRRRPQAERGPAQGCPRPTYLRVEPGGSTVMAAAEQPVSLLPVEAGGRRLLARARPAAQPPQSRRLGPAGHGGQLRAPPAPPRPAPPRPAAHRRRPQPRRSVSCSDAAANRSRSAGSSAAQRRAAHSRHSSTGSAITDTPMAAPSSRVHNAPGSASAVQGRAANRSVVLPAAGSRVALS